MNNIMFCVEKNCLSVHFFMRSQVPRHRLVCDWYRGVSATLLVFDVAHQESFDHVRDWSKEVQCYAREDVVCFLIGNTSNYPRPSPYGGDNPKPRERKVDSAAAYALAAELQMEYLELSTEEPESLDAAFIAMIKKVAAQKMAREEERASTSNQELRAKCILS
eukprot:TRINITY_DN12006_c2_g2_i4.p3 TRINITY_DN12006_c2_g2~~TRINITY_DN12006_c2_g2_i4.p3  ORF type:complete len:163 (+),score=23.23 TRINITY_DN12006_c2_g2_i4:3280-3768(+)